MQCELCGKESPSCRPVLIDGVKMFVCPECTKYGKALEVPKSTSPAKKAKTVRKVEKKEDLFKKMNKILVSNWSEKIKKARMKKGLTREELGFRIGEPTVAITKMENGDLRPSDETVKRLEKELGITLFQEIEEIHLHTSRAHGGLTLGDILKMKEEHEN